MKISATFDETQIKAFSLNFDKKLLRHIEKLKSPDKRIKKALLYFAKTGGKRIRPFLLHYMGSFLNIKPSLLDVPCPHFPMPPFRKPPSSEVTLALILKLSQLSISRMSRSEPCQMMVSSAWVLKAWQPARS